MNGLLFQAAEVLRKTGGRMTAQRRLILETLDTMGGHPTAEEVYAAVSRRDSSINPSTIYRTLGWLAESGLVSPRRLGLERQSRRKEQYDPAFPSEHYHFVCVNCGEVTEFESPRIGTAKTEFALRHGAIVESASLTLHGLCSRCRQTRAATRRAV